ncbi:hypothetical protein [Geitlerinema calcuttense]|uniref:Uncharacterized protein n=1 Tax=Geitlerinema calcuttense NRMC-F 0142 TaxID=2922238 RepID=A0ABT7LV22_9CYAN|nr:hypothetical protein [Geitlerinema calcuttense]MDL5055897.1 hypothetical protein [Geitlerinema calcuttense NRMC-F 0142]
MLKKKLTIADEMDAMPRPPRITPELLEKNDAEQALLRTTSPFDTSVNGRMLQRAKVIVNEMQDIPADDLSPRQKLSYATSLGILGMFDEAYTVSGDERYKAYGDAFTNKECECPDRETYVVENAVQLKRRSRLDMKRRGSTETAGIR